MISLLNRYNLGWYTFVVCFPLSWYYLNQKVLIPFPYREGLTALLSSGNFLPLMIAAIAAAWEGGRLSESSVAIPSSVHSPLTIAGISIAPTVVTTLLSHFTATTIVLAGTELTPPFPDPLIYLGFVVMLAGVAVISWFAGFFLTNVIAAPLMALFVYALSITPSVINEPQYRALVADRSGCCGLEQRVDFNAVMSPVLIAIAFVGIGAAVGAWMWFRTHSSTLAGAIGVIALLIGIVLPGRMEDQWATAPRPIDSLDCEQSNTSLITYCVWPEQHNELPELMRVGDTSFSIWSDQHLLPVPLRVSSEASLGIDEGSVVVGFPPNSSEGRLVLALAMGIIPDPSQCSGTAPDGFDYFQLLIWLTMTTGVSSEDEALQQFKFPDGSGPMGEVLRQRQLPQDQQQVWFRDSMEKLDGCQSTSAASSTFG